MMTYLPGPYDPVITPDRWELAVRDPDVPQHTWLLAPVGAPPPPMVAVDGAFSTDWPRWWTEWKEPGEGKVGIIMRTVPRVGTERSTAEELNPELYRTSPRDEVVLILDQAWQLPPVRPLHPRLLYVPRYQLGIQSAHHDWRLICPQVFTDLSQIFGASIRLEADPHTGDLYSVHIARERP